MMKRSKDINGQVWGWVEGLIGLSLVGYVMAIWWPTKNLLFWGELQEWLVVATDELAARNMVPWAHVEWKTPLPPGFATMLWLAWESVGDKVLGAHGLMLVAVSMLSLSVFAVVKRMAGSLVGLIAAYWVVLSPMVVAGIGWVSVWLWVSGLWMGAAWLWQMGKKAWSVVLLVLGGLSLPSSLLLLPAVWNLGSKKERVDWKENKLLLVPIAAWLVFLVYHQSVMGWWFRSPELAAGVMVNAGIWLRYFLFVIRAVFGWQMRWLFTMGVLAAAVGIWVKDRSDWWSDYIGILGSLVLTWGYWGWKGGFSEEMVVLVWPWMVIVGLVVIKKGLEMWFGNDARLYLAFLAALVGIVWLTQWRPNLETETGFVFRQPADLSYQDRIAISRELAGFIEYGQRDAVVYGGVPESMQLTLPRLGYVEKTQEFEWCREFKIDDSKKQLVVFHPYHESQVDCRKIVDSVLNQRVAAYESNGRWVEVYQILGENELPQREIEPEVIEALEE